MSRRYTSRNSSKQSGKQTNNIVKGDGGGGGGGGLQTTVPTVQYRYMAVLTDQILDPGIRYPDSRTMDPTP
jgi:hypothetical protein